MFKVRKLQIDKKGTYHLSIPIQFVRAMGLNSKMKMSIEQISRNELKIRKLDEKLRRAQDE